MVELDFAAAVASGRIEVTASPRLLAARIENADGPRLCQAAALAALGADDGGQMRAAMTGLERDADAALVRRALAFWPLRPVRWAKASCTRPRFWKPTRATRKPCAAAA
jgi:hypothetical protein